MRRIRRHNTGAQLSAEYADLQSKRHIPIAIYVDLKDIPRTDCHISPLS